MAVAGLSVVVDARYLNQTLEFLTSAKKLPLLLSYGLLFVIVASIVRRAEVPAFLKYTLVLAVLCALGMIWEYRFHYNVFYDWSDKLLPGIFHGRRDTSPRRSTRSAGACVIGPGRDLARGGRDAVDGACPIALVGIMHAGALAQPPPLRPGREHPHGRRDLDLPQDRAHRAGRRPR